ncbi:MAG: STAS domain-containing protein [Clostridia bacterium]|nr:STAS domain-containing protein [Clostridia bacterium]
MENDRIVFMQRNKTLIACIGCEIDHHTAKGLREQIDRQLFIKKPDTLVLDFGSVRFMDSSGLALIIGRAETARALSASVRLVGLSEPLMKLLALSGIEKIKNLTVEHN